MTQRGIRGRGITSVNIHAVINFIAFDAYNIFFIKNTFTLELHNNPNPAGEGGGFICPTPSGFGPVHARRFIPKH